MEFRRVLFRSGLSQVTAVFADGTNIYFARQLINERLQTARSHLPAGVEPEMGPIATGLGEIFMYTLEARPGARKPDGSASSPAVLRTMPDWGHRRPACREGRYQDGFISVRSGSGNK